MPQKTVCVTGATGFIAAFVVEKLLLRGYVVHATVRDLGNESKHAHLLAFDGAAERLKLFQADVTDFSSLAAPIASCDCVMHTATPVIIPMTGEVPQTRAEAEEAQLKPAVEGMIGVVEECRKAGVKHIVLTSSVAAIAGIAPENMPAVLDESCWSDEDFLERTAAWYTLAKTIQEKKAWELTEKYGIKLCTVCPPLVLGSLHTAHFNYSHARFKEIVDGTLAQGPLGENAWLARYGVVDVEDVALCHVLAYEDPSATGRYLTASGRPNGLELCALPRIAAHYPHLAAAVPNHELDPAHLPPDYRYDFSKAEALLADHGGLTPMDTTVQRTLDALGKAGHLEKPRL